MMIHIKTKTYPNFDFHLIKIITQQKIYKQFIKTNSINLRKSQINQNQGNFHLLRTYIITKTLFYTAKQQLNNYSGCIDLTTLEILQDIEGKNLDKDFQKDDKLNGFRLIKNGRVINLYTKNVELFNKWKKILTLRAIQSTFHDEFEVTKMIGKGSFAKVYLANKRETKEEFAIKAFNQEFMTQQHKGKESLVNEIKVMKQLNCDQLLHLYEVYETVNSIYFIVNILKGGELLHRIREKGNLDSETLRILFNNLLLALKHLNDNNIIHRDLKPENLLLKSKDNDYDLVIADFGLATILEDTNSIIFKRCGTPGFVAPEVLLYKDGATFYDEKCDIFSAGVILYLLVSGKQPFQGKDYKVILKANKECKINFEADELKKCPVEILDLLKRLLCPDPQDRISVEQALQHPYLKTKQKDISKIDITEKIAVYEYEYLYNVKQKMVDSQEQIGSLALKSKGFNGMTGKTDTVGSLSSYSNSNLSKVSSSQKINTPSAFKKQNTIEEKDIVQISNQNRKSNANNVMKKAIFNNMSKKNEEQKQ